MSEVNNPSLKRDGLRLWQHASAFLVACAVIVSRQPDAILHPQFWAESGHVFYAEAYNLGWWPAMFRTLTGYFQTLPRLGADIALLVPFHRAPLTLNLIAIAVQALPINLLLASRSSGWGSLRFRALQAAMLLILPNSFEVSVRLPNTQWFLALCAMILIVSSTPRGVAGRLLDGCVLILCGLSGPFCIPLLPISIFVAWHRRERWRWVPAGILFATCIVQARAILFLDPAARSHKALGAGGLLFLRILSSQIYLGALLGGNGLAKMSGTGVSLLLVAALVCGSSIMAFCLIKSGLEMKTFLLFSAALLLASLISPAGAVPAGSSSWAQLSEAPGDRYWFLPTLAFAWSLMWCFYQQNRILKRISTALLCVMLFGVVRDWRNPPFLDTNFPEYAVRFEAAPGGARVIIPISPEGWNMTLVKHGVNAETAGNKSSLPR